MKVKRPQVWSPEEQLNVIIEAATVPDEELNRKEMALADERAMRTQARATSLGPPRGSSPLMPPRQRGPILGILGLLLLSACHGGGSTHPGEINYFDGQGVRNIAHKGGGGIAPENTLVAFEVGLRAGATIIETDVRSTSDGVIVVLHDDTVDRTTEGHGLVNGMTLDEVKALDAGYWFTTDGGASYPYRNTGVRIPTLQETFERLPSERFNIEIKQKDPQIEREVVDLVYSYGMEKQILLSSTSDASLTRVRDLAPDIPTCAGPIEIARFLLLYPDIPPDNPVRASSFQIPVYLPLLFPDLITKAGEAGIEVYLWTVNVIEEMEMAIDLGAKGIITNYPDLLSEVLRQGAKRRESI